ncbi:MAG: hypothetical protein RLZZ269_1959, partial [Actinomycetota bacterium]
LFRRLALEYMTYDERQELGIFSVDERLQPTLPGVEESAVETFNGSEVAADPKSIPSVEELVTQMEMGIAPPAPISDHSGEVRSAVPATSIPTRRCACSAVFR